MNHLFPVPCEVLSVEIGQLERQILETSSPSQRAQLERILATLQSTYQKECEGKRPSHLSQVPISAELTGNSLLLTVKEPPANGVKVIFGGNDGILVTIDGAGHIRITPPEGPGDPEIRQAVTNVVYGLKLLAEQSEAGEKTL